MDSYRKSVAAFILNSKNEVLLVKPIRYGEKEWTVPGGGIETGETAEEAVWREIREEVGLTESDLVLEKKSEIVNTYQFGSATKKLNGEFTGQQKVQFVFKLRSNKPISLRPEELVAHKWVDKKNARMYLTFPGQDENATKVLNN